MSVLKIRDEKTGNFIDIPTIKGKDGAIQYEAGDNIKIENNVISAIIPEKEIEIINKELQKYALVDKAGATLDLTYDTQTHELKSSLLNLKGDILSEKSIALPLESMVVSGRYDNTSQKIILTLQNGNEIEVAVGDLVDGLVSQGDFDSAIEGIGNVLKVKFDVPYYFEYDNNNSDYETTDETTLNMFNEIREAMEYGQHPCLIVRKGATGVNAYQTYHFVVPQFGSFNDSYIMLKGAPTKKSDGTYNVVALNCERDAETGEIIKVYEKKEDSTLQLGDSEALIITSESSDTERIKIMQKAYDLLRKGVMANLTYVTNGLVFKLFDVDKFSNHIDFYVKNGGVGSTRYGIGYYSFDRYNIKCYFSDEAITSVVIEEMSDMFVLHNDAEILGINNNTPYTPEHDYQPANKKYVDERVFTINLTRDEVAGLDADKTQSEIQEAITQGKIIKCAFESDEYFLIHNYNGELYFSGISGTTSTLIICQHDVWTQQTNLLLTDKGGHMSGDIDMEGNSIRNIQELHINGTAPLYFGSTIRTEATTASRLTGIAGGGAALVKANTQAEYAPFFIGDPINPHHAATKGYVDKMQTDSLKEISGYDANKIQILKNINGTFTWVSEN